MTSSRSTVHPERILVLAPLWRDAEVICRTLGQAGMEGEPCSNMRELSREAEAGAGAVLVTEEALGAENELLRQVLADQPVWSDLPVTVLLGGDREAPRGWLELQTILPGSNVTVLTRPVPTSTLISVMNTALRARRRQYQVRQHLRQREERAEELERRVQQRTAALVEAGEELQAARDLFQALFHANPLPVAITRLQDGLFLDVNEAYLRYFGYERQDVVGKTSQELEMWLPGPERDALVARLREQGSVRNREMRSSHPDGRPRTALVSIEVIDLDGTQAAISSFVDVTERKRAEERIRELASQLTMAEHEERHRISQVLHDDLQQQLYSVQIQLTMLRSVLERPALLEEVGEIEAAVATSVDTARNLSVDLSPPILRGEGLTEGIQWIASRMQEQYGLETEIRADGNGSFPVPDHGQRVLFFQIVREILFNAVKHAGVSRVTVHLKHENGDYCVEVRDEGEGFDPEQVLAEQSPVGGHGLPRAQERLQLMGGRLEVESAVGRGTRVSLYLPVAGVGAGS